MKRHDTFITFAVAILGFTLTAATSVSRAANVAQTPLFVTVSVDPNIMFTLDDSGSMQFEILPESLRFGTDSVFPGSVYLFPRASGIYGSDDYANLVVDFDADNKFARYARSSAFNRLYYNPAVTYRPWNNADGSPMANAVATAAYHNPADTAAGTRNLTADNTQSARWLNNDGTAPDYADATFTVFFTSKTFFPATYFRYNGSGDPWLGSSYTKIEIKPESAPFSGSSDRSDCASAPNCTYEEEIQNFANWYTYHRSRVLTARAGIGKAFSQQGSGLRVGFAAINQGSRTIDGQTSPGTIVSGLRRFTGTDRTNFFSSLYGHDIPAEGTPLRQALDDVGQYFQRSDNPGPWGAVPGTNNTSAHLQCRQSYNILMTDGYWNDDAARTNAARANVDGNNGSGITGPGGASFTYTAAAPYSDSWSNTLADVAMYYWYRDLRTDLTNRVPVSLADPAFWQHLVTYTVGFGLSGTLDPATDLPALKDGSKTWPQPSSDAGAVNIDDLWHAAVNSRGEYLSAADPEALAKALSDTLSSIAERGKSSASSVATNSTRLDSNTLIYQAKFDSSDWSGRLLAFQINASDGQIVDRNGNGSINDDDAIWDASSQIPAPGSRDIFTYNPTAGAGQAFLWANLSTLQQTDLRTNPQTAAIESDATGQDRLNYLRGVATNEQKNAGGIFRNRSILLGDIVNSDPWFVGSDNFGYGDLHNPADPGNTSDPVNIEGAQYEVFRTSTSYLQRRRMIYIGANDGMLHGFDAGSFVPAADGVPEHFTQGTGEEIFAYVPTAVYPNLNALTSPSYIHKYYVDGSPKEAPAYIDRGAGKVWRSILMGTTGAGGKGIFALDVTEPDSFTASKVLWDINSTYSPFAADLADITSGGKTTPGLTKGLGYTLAQPSVVRMANGSWAAIVANGYNSQSMKAMLFILDVSTGQIIKRIDTEAGTATAPNGLSTPIAVDTDIDRIVDYIYAGDLQGNLWKFDVTSSSANNWDVAYKSGSTPAPLFVACQPESTPPCNSSRQPITAKPQVGRSLSGGGVMVYFGTGKYFEEGDNVVDANGDGVIDAQIQTFYGIWDVCDKLSSSGCDGKVDGRSALQEQTIDEETTLGDFGLRVSSSTATNYSTKKGWFMDLVKPPSTMREGERVISPPLLRGGRVVFTTLIPSANPCDFGGTGWLMELDAINGSRLPTSGAPWDIYGAAGRPDGVIDRYDLVTSGGSAKAPSGKKSEIGIIKTPGVISGGTLEYKYTSGSSGALEVTTETGSGAGGRQAWRQLR